MRCSTWRHEQSTIGNTVHLAVAVSLELEWVAASASVAHRLGLRRMARTVSVSV